MLNMLDMEFIINRYAMLSYRTAILAIIMLLITAGFYIFIERDKVLLYITAIEFSMFGYMVAYGNALSSVNPEKVIFYYRIMYIFITLLHIFSLYMVAYLNQKQYKWGKRCFTAVGILIMVSMVTTETILTKEVTYIFHVTVLKGEFFYIYMLYNLAGVIGIIGSMLKRCIRDCKNIKESKYLYIGIAGFLLHMYFSAYTSAYVPTVMPHLFANVLFYAIMIIIFFYHRIRENMRGRERLYDQYVYDQLTKVYSRSYFFAKLEKEYERQGEMHILLGMIDMNRFKRINDTYGHTTGDEVLQKLGELLHTLPDNVHVGRIGGDEFMMFSTEIEEEIIIHHIRRIMKEYEAYIKCCEINNEDKEIGISFGYIYQNEPMEIDDIISLCDKAMYRAKALGNNQIIKS